MKCMECEKEDAIVGFGGKSLCLTCFDVAFGLQISTIIDCLTLKEAKRAAPATPQQGSRE